MLGVDSILVQHYYIHIYKFTVRIRLIQPLSWGTVYCASNCTDFSNFIFAIKQGGLDKTFDV